MTQLNLRVIVRLAVLFSLIFALFLTQGWAGTITNQGSTATSRTTTDIAVGQVYIYNGDVFPTGETVTTFNWFGPTFSGSRDLTPLLFSDNNGIFTVVGIGSSTVVSGGMGSSSEAFGLQAGSSVTGSTWTFGFVTGLTDSTGVLSSTSAGSVPHNSPVDSGAGIDPGSTNDWVFTPSLSGINVTLGSTFGIPGSNGSIDFTLNNPNNGGSSVDRTYSANADGISGVAEPGTFSLITGAGLVLAGLFRYRYTRGRRS